MKRKLFILALAGLLLLAANLAAPPELSWYAITGGGGNAAAGIYILDSAIGQPAVGVIANSGSQVCAGFLCGAGAYLQVYAPLIRK